MIGLRKNAAKTVADMLDQQHHALLAGDLDALGKMAPKLSRAFERLRREGGDLEVVTGIQGAAARNARLLMAAQAGVATARAHLQSARSSQLTTYGADGQSQKGAPAPSGSVVRR
ncbi:hypothetical protein [Gymnodinialimonas sp. 57CJ19]|uniref:hypothetical protein n=1 Tax=Gymnodinialimonas sp. 57CJ19 TaxID=3138498 RepID=UPI0031345AA0